MTTTIRARIARTLRHAANKLDPASDPARKLYLITMPRLDVDVDALKFSATPGKNETRLRAEMMAGMTPPPLASASVSRITI